MADGCQTISHAMHGRREDTKLVHNLRLVGDQLSFSIYLSLSLSLSLSLWLMGVCTVAEGTLMNRR